MTHLIVLVEGLTHSEKKLLIKKIKLRQSKEERVGECGFCTVLACPPHPTQSLSLKATTNAFASLFFLVAFCLCFQCNCLSAASAPSSQYLQMGEESYFEFLVIIWYPFLFFTSFSPLVGYPSKYDFLCCFSIHPIHFSCFHLVGTLIWPPISNFL